MPANKGILPDADKCFGVGTLMEMVMKYRDKIQRLTLEQKCALLSGADVFKTRAFHKMGIPSLWLTDGPHGLRKQAGASDHLGLNPSEPAVCYPTAATAACSWDTKLGEEIGEALAQEAIEQGVDVILGPGLNIKRSPLCGRNFEYFSEDPYLAGKMAAAYVRGIQKNGVAACPKHFAVNNQETRRMVSNSILDERTLREIYLTGFEIVVKEGKPQTIMSSYNLLNGIYANENRHLLVDILRKEWGYQGAVVTDWGCSNDHAQGVKAGSTLEMPCPGWDSVRELLAAQRSGKVSEQEIDDRVAELLALIAFTKGGKSRAEEAAKGQKDAKGRLQGESEAVLWEEHHKLAYRAAAKSLTLLRNEGDILPLAKGTKTALIGDFARTPRYQGAGSSQVNVLHPASVLECMKDSGLTLTGYAKGFDRLGKPDHGLQKEAVELAARAQAVILCLGLDEVQESEGIDRQNMRLAKPQIALLKAVAAVNSNVIVVLFSGSVVETGWRRYCKALLYAGLGGEAGAQAVVDAINGTINPGGKLAETWPECYEDTPAKNYFATEGRNVEYRESIYVGYRYYQKRRKKPAFPFGFGLSYTKFTYSGLHVEKDRVEFTVTNTGSRPGAEIAQLYILPEDIKGGIFRAVKELKGFTRVELEAGESRQAVIYLDDKAFRYWNEKSGSWEIETGDYQIEIGSSSEAPQLTETVFIEGTKTADGSAGKVLIHYQTGDVQQVPDQEFAALLGHEIPKPERVIDRHITFGEMKYGRSPLGWLVCGIFTKLLQNSLQKGKPDLNLLFIYNMPLHALSKMTNGMVSMGMVDGIVMELQGFWLLGLIKVLVEFIKNRIQNRRMEKKICG